MEANYTVSYVDAIAIKDTIAIVCKNYDLLNKIVMLRVNDNCINNILRENAVAIFRIKLKKQPLCTQ